MSIFDYPLELGLISVILTLVSILISVAEAGGQLIMTIAFRTEVPGTTFDRILIVGSVTAAIVSWCLTLISVAMLITNHVSLH